MMDLVCAMRKIIMALTIIALTKMLLIAQPVIAQSKYENRINLFNEFIREIIVFHKISEQGTKEISEAKNANEQFATAISNGERYKIECAKNINLIDKLDIDEQFNFVKEYLMQWNYSKAIVMMDFAAISERLLMPPKNYNPTEDTILAPKLTARSQKLDEDFMKISTAMLLMLVDETPDANGNMSNLIINKKQKDRIIYDINLYFQNYENKQNNNYFIESGLLVKNIFEKKGYNFAK